MLLKRHKKVELGYGSLAAGSTKLMETFGNVNYIFKSRRDTKKISTRINLMRFYSIGLTS